MQPEYTKILTDYIIPSLASILIALISWATAKAVAWIKERAKGERSKRLALLIGHLENAVESTVTTAQETVVKGLKNDGKFTPEEQAAVKQAVMDSVMRQAGPIVKEVTDMGVIEVQEILHNKIENAVAWKKRHDK